MLGDAAYRGLHDRVITPVIGRNLTPDQQEYNAACTRIRQIVERSIGATQLKWRVQQLKSKKIDWPPRKALHLLHNAQLLQLCSTTDLPTFCSDLQKATSAQ